MKTLPAGLAAALASGATTLCWCWRVDRADGAVYGFTDHDATLSFDAVDYAPDTGWTGSEIAASLGLAVDTQEVEGVLSSDAITEADVAAGLWDGARVTLFRVDWSAPANRVAVFAGSFGEISRGPTAHRVELRSLAHALNQRTGRTYSALCDAELGDARCGVDLDDPDYRSTGTVAEALSRSAFMTAGLSTRAAGWCSRGRLTWTSGANAGRESEVRSHRLSGAQRRIDLAEPPPGPLAVGDAFEVQAGCDRSAETCRAKFANIENFRGFPHMPGNDWMIAYPVPGETSGGRT